MNKKISRLRRSVKTRAKLKSLGAHRLAVHRTSKHIYAQVLSPAGDVVLAAASTVEAVVNKGLATTSNITAAEAVGKAVAERAVKEGITDVAFDRSGFKYHGRVKALADAARESGLKF